MTFTINRKALEAELALLQTVAERKGTIPILSTVMVQVADGKCRLVATDMDMALSTEIPAAGESWSGCVPSKQLYELMRLLSGDTVEFRQDEGRLEVKWGRSRHRLPIYSIEHYPVIEQPDTETATVNGLVFATAIKRAAACVTTDAIEDWMQGVTLRTHDGAMFVVGTNSRHFSLSEIPLALNLDVPVPLRAALALVKLLSDGDAVIGATDNHLIVKQDQRAFTTRLLVRKFPDWRPLVPPKYDYEMKIDAEAARQAFKLASVTSLERELIRVPVRLTFSQSEILIETEDSDRGDSSEVLIVDSSTLNGKPLSKRVNGGHFINFLDFDGKAVMGFNSDLRLIQLSPEGEPNYRYITMSLK